MYIVSIALYISNMQSLYWYNDLYTYTSKDGGLIKMSVQPYFIVYLKTILSFHFLNNITSLTFYLLLAFNHWSQMTSHDLFV